MKASDGGEPAAGAVVTLERTGDECSQRAPLTNAKTDSEGYAQFDHVQPGEYNLCARSPMNGTFLIEWVKVSRWTKKDQTIETSVEGWNPLRVRTANGSIRSWKFYPSMTQRPILVELEEVGTGAKLFAAATNDRGKYAFEEAIAPGRYWLRIHSDPNAAVAESGTLLIEVSATAPAPNVDIDVTASDCGLTFLQQDRAKEEETAVRMATVCGVVTDPAEAFVSDAELILTDLNGERRASARTNRDGYFLFAPQGEGTYELIASRPGFAPTVRRVIVTPRGGSCTNPLKLELTL